MALNAGEVFVLLGGRFNAAGFNAYGSAVAKAKSQSTAFQTQNERAATAMSRLGTVAKGTAAVGVIGLGVAIGKSVKVAASFEAQLSSLGSVADASAKQMSALRKQALEAGAATKFSALDAAKAQTELAKGGLSVEKILKGGLKGALALAAAGEMDLATAAATTANALQQFKLDGDEATHVADALATAANATTFDVSDLAAGLAQGGSAAKLAGLSFDETVTALEALSAVTSSGSDAGTSLKAALTQVAKPSDEAAETMKRLGLAFFDASGSMKPLPQLSEMLRDKLGKLTDEQRIATLTTLAGTDGQRALAAIMDAGAPKLERYANQLHQQGTAARVAAEKQDNLQGRIENLKGSIETAGIVLGTTFLPLLDDGARKATAFINDLQSSGDLQQFADGLAGGARGAVEILGDVVTVGGEVVGTLADIAQALQLDNVNNLEALAAGLAAFKVAGAVAPSVMRLGEAIAFLVLNARTAPSIGAFLASLGARVNPITAAAAGVGLLTGYLVKSALAESNDEKQTRLNAAAKRDLKQALDSLAGVERDSVDAKLAAQDSTLRVKEAEQALADVRKNPKATALQIARAEQDLAQARADSSRRHNEYEKALRGVNREQEKSRSKANERLQIARKELDAAKAEADVVRKRDSQGGATPKEVKDSSGRLAKAQREYAAAMRDFGTASREVNVSELNRERIAAGVGRVTRENAAGVQFLVAQLQKVPKNVRSKLKLDGDQEALGRAGELAAQLISLGRQKTVTRILAQAGTARGAVIAFKAILAGVPATKVSSILTNAGSEKGKVDQLRQAIASIGNKTATITINKITTEILRVTGAKGHASGRGRTGEETALVGEGGGPEWRVNPRTGEAERIDGPQLRRLDADDYIIPTEGRYRARGLGLLSMVARDLGIPGYGTGRAKKKRAVPKASDYLRLSPEEFENDVQRLEQIAEHRDKKNKLTKGAKKARSQLGDARALRDRARRYAALIEKDSELADIERQRMENADKRDDQKGYDRARGLRGAALRRERGRLVTALKFAKPGTKWARSIQAALARLDGERLDLKDAAASVLDTPTLEVGETEADRLKDTGMTDAERARLQNLDAATSLAKLTESLDDDRAAAAARVTFLQGVLDAVQGDPARGGAGNVSTIADALVTAKSDLASLTTGGTNQDADLQARIDQANERTRIAQTDAAANLAALAAFVSSGDIGTGQFANARDAAAGVTVNVNTLHPGDPRVYDAIGRAATIGQDMQRITPNAPVWSGY